MTTIHCTRVNANGTPTGTADLGVTREGDYVIIKLGQLRAELTPGQQARLLGAVLPGASARDRLAELRALLEPQRGGGMVDADTLLEILDGVRS